MWRTDVCFDKPVIRNGRVLYILYYFLGSLAETLLQRMLCCFDPVLQIISEFGMVSLPVMSYAVGSWVLETVGEGSVWC